MWWINGVNRKEFEGLNLHSYFRSGELKEDF